jgi:hypothetical protein
MSAISSIFQPAFLILGLLAQFHRFPKPNSRKRTDFARAEEERCAITGRTLSDLDLDWSFEMGAGSFYDHK